jgi:hypothetical protein
MGRGKKVQASTINIQRNYSKGLTANADLNIEHSTLNIEVEPGKGGRERC